MKKVVLVLLIIFSISSVGVIALSLCNAKDIEYNASDTTWDVDTVEDALNDLYQGNNGVLSESECLPFVGRSFEYEYTGDVQNFTTFCAGDYRIELWGADGGKMRYNGAIASNHGLGAYTSGEIYLNGHTTLYIYVGGKGEDGVVGQRVNGGFNGGGQGDWDTTDDEAGGGGGGATDVRLTDGAWDNFDSLKSRIMVAAGAGGTGYKSNVVGYGGGLEADTLYDVIYGGTQTSGGDFGVGSDGWCVLENEVQAAGGGGGGYYGGTSYMFITTQNGSGGSSYVSGHNGCSSVTKDSTEDNITHTLSAHYSGFVFTNTKIIDGNGYIWTTKKEAQVGRPAWKNSQSGYGYAVITYLGKTGSEPKTCYEGETIKISYKYANTPFKMPCDGKYQIELWGASGGRSLVTNALTKKVALGAYTSGQIDLNKDKQLYFYVGGKGSDGIYKDYAAGGYNGGGNARWDYSDDESGGGGGGATDVRLVNGNWDNFDSLKSRIMVAAGGGGDADNLGASAGGGLYAQTLFDTVQGGTQTSGYKFGSGQYAGNKTNLNIGVGGGGGGYYGGLVNEESKKSSGTGGSSFISGHKGCDAILESSIETKIVHSGQPNHYSNYIFTETKMIDGDGYEWVDLDRGAKTQMPNTDGTGLMDGNTGNGVARITYLGK